MHPAALSVVYSPGRLPWLCCMLQDVQATGAAHLEATEHNVLSALRQQVKVGLGYCAAYPYAGYGAAAVGLMLFPGPRRFLFRNVFGFLQSPVRLPLCILLEIPSDTARSVWHTKAGPGAEPCAPPSVYPFLGQNKWHSVC